LATLIVTVSSKMAVTALGRAARNSTQFRISWQLVVNFSIGENTDTPNTVFHQVAKQCLPSGSSSIAVYFIIAATTSI
jgi:hypothetical protein